MQGESYTRRANKLKEEVRMMLDEVVDPVNQLELIDIVRTYVDIVRDICYVNWLIL